MEATQIARDSGAARRVIRDPFNPTLFFRRSYCSTDSKSGTWRAVLSILARRINIALISEYQYWFYEFPVLANHVVFFAVQVVRVSRAGKVGEVP
jgi:hypothetical protein